MKPSPSPFIGKLLSDKKILTKTWSIRRILAANEHVKGDWALWKATKRGLVKRMSLVREK